jgi:hypothetical protein
MSKPLRLVRQAAQTFDYSCPLCSGAHAAYVFGTSQFRIYRCAGCALTFSFSKFRGSVLSEGEAIRQTARSEKDHAKLIAAIEAGPISGPVLLMADSDYGIAPLLQRRGISIGRVVNSNDLGSNDWGGTYNTAIVSSALMASLNPKAALEKIRRHLAISGKLILSLPLLDGHQARLMGRKWHEWQPSNLWYFTRETLTLLLLAAGFEHVWSRVEKRTYSLNNLIERMSTVVDGTAWLRGLELLRRMSPKKFHNKEFRLLSGTAVVTATVAPARSECVVSIVVPVFNEKKTLKEMMDGLLAKQLPGIRKEIIIVESNSTDGSRELVQSYKRHPDVRIIWQSEPRGKGFAVRAGIKAATGDIVMIQDADLEYDFDDYDGLLAPLVDFQSMFVLGSRHQGGWKMRKFSDAPLLASMLNQGHSFFRTLINLVVHTDMDDPFTMFKVVRRDALYGLDFVCNRFDFDIEFVIKLVRKGYTPVELPVNYESRSFSEGKKVSVMRDGLTWIWTILRARFCKLGSVEA